MAKFSQLTPPVTNQKIANRIADTEAVKARQAVAAAPMGQPIQAAAAQTGAALAQQSGQQALQAQQQQAGMAKQQAGLELNKQRMGQQQQTFDRQQRLGNIKSNLDKQLFNLGQDIARQEQNQRLSFMNEQANQKFLNEQTLMDWTVANFKDEQQFKDRVQKVQQAHAKNSMMIDHAFKLKMQDLRQQEASASGARKRELRKELAEIQAAHQREQARRKAEAANRQAMIEAGSTILAAGATAGLVIGAGMAAPLAVPVAAGIAAAGTVAGNELL